MFPFLVLGFGKLISYFNYSLAQLKGINRPSLLGSWGIFGDNAHAARQPALEPPEKDALLGKWDLRRHFQR